MPDGGLLLGTPQNLQCEAKMGPRTCPGRATHVYGPECEAETGKLMYLCANHVVFIQEWMAKNPNEPVECKTHGNIGPVKNYVILKELT